LHTILFQKPAGAVGPIAGGANVLQSGYLCRRFMISKWIIQLLDWLYPYFSKLMPRQTFYYAACGGGNTILALVVFFICENFVFEKQPVDLFFIVLKSHKAAMVASFLFSFPIGFYLAKNVVFSGSTMRGRQQLLRYFISNMLSLLLNYINLTILVEWLHFYPTFSQVINTIIVVIFSYLAQKHFAFRKKKQPTTL
jgi:putative flippase GtrA